jgi:hypothetical protein
MLKILSMPWISYGIEMAKLANQAKYNAVIERDDEIRRTIQVYLIGEVIPFKNEGVLLTIEEQSGSTRQQ